MRVVLVYILARWNTKIILQFLDAAYILREEDFLNIQKLHLMQSGGHFAPIGTLNKFIHNHYRYFTS